VSRYQKGKTRPPNCIYGGLLLGGRKGKRGGEGKAREEEVEREGGKRRERKGRDQALSNILS